MNVLVTGGAGFIGSNLSEELVNMGHNVIALDVKKSPKNLHTLLGNINYVQGDVRDKKILESIFRANKIDGVVHLAAVSRVVWGENDPRKCFDVNVNGTRILLELIKKSNQRPWVIFGSSREVYGEPNKLPVCENCKKIPINIYGVTKIASENFVREYSNEIKLDSAILRFSNVYGNERDILDRVIPRFILSAIKGEELEIHGGNQLFDFTHIKDTVEGIIKTIDFLNKNGWPHTEDFHILTGRGTTLQDVVEIISKNLDEEPKVIYKRPRNYDVERFVGDPTKAFEIINFKAKILPEEGIPATLDRYKEAFGL